MPSRFASPRATHAVPNGVMPVRSPASTRRGRRSCVRDRPGERHVTHPRAARTGGGSNRSSSVPVQQRVPPPSIPKRTLNSLAPRVRAHIGGRPRPGNRRLILARHRLHRVHLMHDSADKPTLSFDRLRLIRWRRTGRVTPPSRAPACKSSEEVVPLREVVPSYDRLRDVGMRVTHQRAPVQVQVVRTRRLGSCVREASRMANRAIRFMRLFRMSSITSLAEQHVHTPTKCRIRISPKYGCCRIAASEPLFSPPLSRGYVAAAISTGRPAPLGQGLAPRLVIAGILLDHGRRAPHRSKRECGPRVLEFDCCRHVWSESTACFGVVELVRGISGLPRNDCGARPSTDFQAKIEVASSPGVSDSIHARVIGIHLLVGRRRASTRARLSRAWAYASPRGNPPVVPPRLGLRAVGWRGPCEGVALDDVSWTRPTGLPGA